MRERAARVSASFDSLMSRDCPIAAAIDLHFIPSTPHVEMSEYGLNREWNDNWLIAAVLAWKKSHRAADSILITDSMDASLTCRRLHIDTVRLPSRYRQQRGAGAEEYVGGLR
jgi:hypothetical protein